MGLEDEILDQELWHDLFHPVNTENSSTYSVLVSNSHSSFVIHLVGKSFSEGIT